jgi:iron complex transport system substrate-binding protein
VTLSASRAARAITLLLLLVLLAACGGAESADPGTSEAPASATSEAAAGGNLTDGCVENFSADTDYFPDKVTFDEATGVSVRYEKSYKVVEVTTLAGEKPLQYVLLQCGAEKPELDAALAKAQVIEVPARKVVTLTTTNLPHFVELGAAERVVGVGTAAYVASPEILKRVKAGDVKDFANGDGMPNQEKIIGAQPDLLLMDAFGETIVEEANRFVDAGVPTVLSADFNEEQLLGRAEWLKFTSLFLNAEKQANATFDQIASKYNEVKTAAADAKEQPTVFANTPMEGTWFAPGGNSFFANAVKDANAKYVFAGDKSTYSLELDIETMLNKAGDADVWLQAGSVQGTLSDLLKTDERFKEFKAFRKGEVWAWDKAMAPGGGNAFFETGYTRADLVLSDLVKILHPEALPDHQLVFFGKVPRAKKG